MITYISGPKNSGKTTTLLALLRKEPSAGGFFQHKLLQNGVTTGYDLIRIRDGQRIPFARQADNLPSKWDAGPELGRYSFSVSGIKTAIRFLREDLAKACSPLVLDEVGKLELNGAGFFPLLEELEEQTLILVVRDAYLQAVQKLMKTAKAGRIIHCFATTPGCPASGENELQRSLP